MLPKLNRRRKIKGNRKLRNFKKGSKLFKPSTKRQAKSRLRSSKKTKCNFSRIQA